MTKKLASESLFVLLFYSDFFIYNTVFKIKNKQNI